jgi:probable HAF family extracellular repeat protein
MPKKWIELHASLDGVSRNGDPAYVKTSKSIDLGGVDVRIHETAASGGAVLVSGDHLTSCSTTDVQLKIFHPEGNPEYISTPVRTPIELKSVTRMNLRVFVPVGNPACSKITYRGHVSAQCVYEALGSGSTGAMFQGLGNWRVRGISADGSVVVGSRQVGTDSEAVRWTRETGLVGLGHLAGGNKSYAYAASQDGTVIVGASDSGTAGLQAFRWTQSSGLEALGTLPGDSTSQAYDVTADGSLVVGKSGNRATVWTAAEGLQPLPGIGDISAAHAVSADGSVIAGESRGEGDVGPMAFRWTAGCGLVNITPDEGMSSRAAGISADGYTVVGTDGNVDDAFIWTPNTCAINPDTIEDAAQSLACDASADGSIVVGFGNDSIIWDMARGGAAAYLKDVLTDELGLDLTGWQIEGSVYISDDGLTIAGNGNGPDDHAAWIARLG